MSSRLHHFVAGPTGDWTITSQVAVVGADLPPTSAITPLPGGAPIPLDATWTLDGVTSNARYLTADEAAALRAVQEGLGRPAATRAALIPIRKTAAWWALAQDERRALVEERSHHISLGLRHLPAIARRLHHCRDLPGAQPFDFLTWFEYAPEHEAAFDELVAALRSSPEWAYVDREVDIRLRR